MVSAAVPEVITGFWSDALVWLGIAINFIPLLWLAWLAYRHERRDVAFWWIAAAFALGGLSDLAAKAGLGAPMAGKVYPVGQSALIAAVLLDKHTALSFLLVLGWAAFASVLFWPTHPDVAVHTIAWGGLGWVAWRCRAVGLLSWSLLAAFGAALPAYYLFLWSRSLLTWLLLQTCYVVGLALFCYAASRRRPALKVR